MPLVNCHPVLFSSKSSSMFCHERLFFNEIRLSSISIRSFFLRTTTVDGSQEENCDLLMGPEYYRKRTAHASKEFAWANSLASQKPLAKKTISDSSSLCSSSSVHLTEQPSESRPVSVCKRQYIHISQPDQKGSHKT